MTAARLAAAVTAAALAALALVPCAEAAARHASPRSTSPAAGSTASAAGSTASAAGSTASAAGSTAPVAGYSDPFAQLGARSPFCARAVGPRAREYCRASGSIAHAYPLSSYGLDNQIGTSITDVHSNLLAALQDIAAFAWLALVFLMKGVLLLLEWAFSIDLLDSAMGAVRSGLDTLHRDVLGHSWFLAALALCGCWGIWRGLVQRRTTDTIAGLAGTVALMVAALVLISNPEATVGRASRLSDDASLGIVAATAGGRVTRPEQSFASSLEGVFDTVVLRPWAALEFGDVAWALRPARPGAAVTNADVWLAFPADSPQRRSLYKLQTGQRLGGSGLLDGLGGLVGGALEGPLGQAIGAARGIVRLSQGGDAQLSDAIRAYVRRDPSKVQMQEAGGTFPRLALLALIAFGLLGAVLLFLYIGVKLLLASIMSLLLVLLAPAMLLAPAFGASGRAATVTWAKRLAGAVASKLVYSLMLAVTLVGSAAVESLELGWFATWLVLIAFWWGVLLKRRDLLGFAPAAIAPARDGGGGVMRAFYGMRAASWALGGVARALPQLGSPPALERARPPDANAAADIGRRAGEELQQRYAEVAQEEAQAARSRISRRADLEAQLRDLPVPAEGDPDAAQTQTDRPAAAHGSGRRGRRAAADTPIDPLTAERDALRARLRSASLERRFDTPDDGARGNVEGWLARRGRELDDPSLGPEDPRHLEAAGIDPLDYGAADAEHRAELRERSARVIEHDRKEVAIAAALDETPAIDHRRHLPRLRDRR